MNFPIGFLILSLAQAPQAPVIAGNDAPSRATIAGKDEPGDPLVVAGQVFGPDGKTPIAGASVYVYQTGQDGIYSKPVNDSRNPRLRGYMRTDASGRYEYRTIKPGSYPDTRNPAHIHYVVNAPGFKERIFEIVFADDPLVDARIRDRAAREDSPFSIRTLSRDNDGVLHCRQDVLLKK